MADLLQLAAALRERLLAEVRTAAPLTDEQESRLVAALRRLYDRDVQLQVEIDPSLVGGLVVRIGDEIIDGSVARRLDEARRRLVR